MDVTCHSIPPDIISDNKIKDIKFFFSNATSDYASERLITITGNNDGRICFQCGHQILKTVLKCYDYYNKPFRMYITPEDIHIYISRERTTLRCVVDPVEMYNLITGIDFINHTKTGKVQKGVRSLVFQNFDQTFCATCGHPLLGYISKCLTRFDQKVTIKIIPDDSNVYFLNKDFTIYCLLNPSYILTKKLISNFTFETNFTNHKKISETEIFIGRVTDLNIKMCFRCGHSYFSFVSRCYIGIENYDIVIEPNDVNIYLVNISMIVECRLFPTNLHNLLRNIDFFNVTVPFTKLRPRKIQFGPLDPQNLITVCLSCGHRITKNVTKCYQPYKGKVVVKIKPDHDFIYYRLENYIKCTYSPYYTQPKNIPFTLSGLDPKYYVNEDFLSKRIVSNFTLSSNKICVTCGEELVVKASKCYRLLGDMVSIEILPPVEYYLTYDDQTDIICQTNPFLAMDQFESLKYTYISLQSYRTITKRHVQICYPKDSCVGLFCFTCEAKGLISKKICYQPIDYKIKLVITPEEESLYFMWPHQIQCSYHPFFTTYDRISLFIHNLIEGTDYIRQRNLTIKINHHIHLYNRKVCVSCSKGIPSMDTKQCYILKANITFEYRPKFLLYMVYHSNFNISAYCIWNNLIYPTPCLKTMGPSGLDIKLSQIYLTKKTVGGNYKLICTFPNSENKYDIELNVDNRIINITIIPKSENIYYLFNPRIECSYNPDFISINEMQISVEGLKYYEYRRYSISIVLLKLISLLQKKVCFSCFYPGLINRKRCFLLVANVSFEYYPKLDLYLTGYYTFTIVTYFKHLVFPRLKSDCKLIQQPGNTPPPVNEGNITLHKNLVPGDYKFSCILENTTIPKNLTLKTFRDKISLTVLPDISSIILTQNQSFYCDIKPKYIPTSLVNIYSLDTTTYVKSGHILYLPNSIRFHERCLCFSCVLEGKEKVIRCYFTEIALTLKLFPEQNIYFAWSKMTVQTFFVDKYKPGRTYNALCTSEGRHHIQFVEGSLVLNSKIKNGTYKLECTLFNLPRYYDTHIMIYSPLVYVWISPNDTDVFLHTQPLEVSCNVQPLEILYFLKNFGFTSINTKEYKNISKRSIMIGGRRNKSNSTICVVCGHKFLPIESAKCYSPYGGIINVTILPLAYELFIFEHHEIVCRFTPMIMKISQAKIRLVGITRESYTIFRNLTIVIKKDKTLLKRKICVVCGDRKNMNATRCYFLTAEEESRLSTYFAFVGIILGLFFVIYYITKNEVM